MGTRLAWVIAAGGFCLVGLVLTAVMGGAAWRAWLSAAFLWAAAPIGATALLMIMRLIPGAWTDEFSPSVRALASLLPLVSVLVAPILFVVPSLYLWAREAPTTGFRAVYLSEPFFVVRTVAWLILLNALSLVMLRHQAAQRAWACAGLIAFTLGGTLIAVDWLLSLDPEFSSSGFGLYVICIQMLTAVAIAVAAAVVGPLRITRPGLLGGLLLTLLLLWAYFAFMHYFITWSDNLPPGVRWYDRRTTGVWGLVTWILVATRLVPAFLLLFGPLRRSRVVLLSLAGVVVAGTVVEAAWLALPAPAEAATVRLPQVALYAALVLAMGALSYNLFAPALGSRARTQGT